jgi:hypothetical protein
VIVEERLTALCYLLQLTHPRVEAGKLASGISELTLGVLHGEICIRYLLPSQNRLRMGARSILAYSKTLPGLHESSRGFRR